MKSENEVAPSDLVKDNMEALANVNPACPNGCIENGPGCNCHGTHEGLREYDWKD